MMLRHPDLAAGRTGTPPTGKSPKGGGSLVFPRMEGRARIFSDLQKKNRKKIDELGATGAVGRGVRVASGRVTRNVGGRA